MPSRLSAAKAKLKAAGRQWMARAKHYNQAFTQAELKALQEISPDPAFVNVLQGARQHYAFHRALKELQLTPAERIALLEEFRSGAQTFFSYLRVRLRLPFFTPCWKSECDNMQEKAENLEECLLLNINRALSELNNEKRRGPRDPMAERFLAGTLSIVFEDFGLNRLPRKDNLAIIDAFKIVSGCSDTDDKTVASYFKKAIR